MKRPIADRNTMPCSTQAARRRYGKGGPAIAAVWALVGVIVLTSLAGGAGMGGAVAATSWYIQNKLPPVTAVPISR